MQFPHWRDAGAAGCPPQALLLIIDAQQQQLTLFDQETFVARYPVSTSAAGLGCEEGSFKTPVGWHEVLDRIGAGAPLGQVFKNRKPVSSVFDPKDATGTGTEDLILTRILRLAGREPGKNQGFGIDSYERFIYIHGTQEEDRLGTPASHGCIRMASADIAALFDILRDRPAWCWIGQVGNLAVGEKEGGGN